MKAAALSTIVDYPEMTIIAIVLGLCEFEVQILND